MKYLIPVLLAALMTLAIFKIGSRYSSKERVCYAVEKMTVIEHVTHIKGMTYRSAIPTLYYIKNGDMVSEEVGISMYNTLNLGDKICFNEDTSPVWLTVVSILYIALMFCLAGYAINNWFN